MYKFLITARGWIVICVVVFITIFICNNQKIAYSEDEKKRDEYYQQYGGRDYSGLCQGRQGSRGQIPFLPGTL